MTAQPLEPRVSRLEGAFEQIVERLGDTNARLETLELKLDANFHSLDSKIAAMDAKFELKFTAVDSKFTAMDTKIESRFDAVDRKFSFLIGTYVASTLTIIGVALAAILPLYGQLAHLTRLIH